MTDKDLIFCTDCKTYQYPDHDCKYAPGCPGHEDIYSGVGRLCPQCRADLELGRLVRGMPKGRALKRNVIGWTMGIGPVKVMKSGDTPEEALKGGKS